MIDEKKLLKALQGFHEREEEYKSVFDEQGIYYESQTGLIDEIIKYVQKMPKVGNWIPCSERLPEEARAVEVTMYDGNRAIGHFNNRLDTWFDSINGGFIDVIAWKKPSEPWKGEDK